MAAKRKLHVIVNPASGRDAPILNTLNRVFSEHSVAWDVSITHGPGDAQRQAREAMESGADLVAGYGGDGTLMEIADALCQSDVPLGVLPGGTGNSIARELRIPFDLSQAAELVCKTPRTRSIDLARVNDRTFMLHAYSGVRPSQQAARSEKDSLGIFAYLLSTLRVLADPLETRYFLSVDGEESEQDGVVCFVLNALGVGLDVPIAKTVRPDDGLLDVILLKKATVAALPGLLQEELTGKHLQHWQGREIAVRPQTAQTVWLDGEEDGETPFTAVAVPQALRIVVPG